MIFSFHKMTIRLIKRVEILDKRINLVMIVIYKKKIKMKTYFKKFLVNNIKPIHKDFIKTK